MQATGGKHRDGSPMPKPHQTPLAHGRVRYVGDPVALVVAETREAAKDAAEAVVLDIEPLPAVTDARAAAAADAPQLHDEAPGNLVLDFHFGDTVAVDAAFAGAAHVTRLDLRNSRIVVAAMEPRSAIAAVEDGRLVLRVGCQGVFGLRGTIAAVMNVPHEQVRVLTGQCRRLVRHEGRGVSRIHRAAARRADAWPPGEVDRCTVGQLPIRQPRP